MERWDQIFLDWLGHPLPDDYLVFDLESTGFRRKMGTETDLPVDIGYCLVRGREIVRKGHHLLNWTTYPGIERGWLVHKLEAVRSSMAEQGKVFPYTIELLEAEGRPPDAILKFYWQLFVKNRRAGAAVVGHNAWSFDTEMFTSVLKECLDIDFEFLPNELYDTGAMEKAIVAGDMEPYPDERTLKEYFLRVVRAQRAGVYWNIEACLQRHNMTERFNLKEEDLHNAGADAHVTHLMFEEHRRVIKA